MAFGDVAPGFGGSGGFDAPAPGGSADIGLPNLPPPPKKKKPPTTLPVTPLPVITPPSPVADSTAAFQNTLAGIVAGFEQRLAAASAPPPVAAVSRPPSLPVSGALGGGVGFQPIGNTFGNGGAPTLLDSAPPVPPAVPKKVPAQGVTPAAAAAKQRRTAAGDAKARTILTSGQGLLDQVGDESKRARKTLLGA